MYLHPLYIHGKQSIRRDKVFVHGPVFRRLTMPRFVAKEQAVFIEK